MSRSFIAVAIGIAIASDASAQCGHWFPGYSPPVYYYPPYSVSPWQFWGTPPPRLLPPAPKPFVPKKGVGVREKDEPATKNRNGANPKNGDSKDKEPRIPKVKLPGLPDDPDEPKKSPAKKEPVAGTGRSVEQYIVPAEASGATPGPEVKVGFFNHSDREITLVVNGESLKLPSEQYVTLKVKRTFTWAEQGQKAKEVAVPPDADGIEIVFRR